MTRPRLGRDGVTRPRLGRDGVTRPRLGRDGERTTWLPFWPKGSCLLARMAVATRLLKAAWRAAACTTFAVYDQKGAACWQLLPIRSCLMPSMTVITR